MKLILIYGLLFCLFQKAYSQEAMKDTSVLKEAVIRGRKPLVQQRPDGIVVNVENSIMTKGSSALEVLERSAGIIIDRRNNNIFLNGKDGVMVMFDGKLMRMPLSQVITLLQGMSADDIEKIELLTTPPSKYDADGSAGLINIVLKKNKRRGTHGNLSVTGGYGWREKSTASLNLAHNTQRSNLYGTYSFSHDRTYTNVYITGTNDFPVLGGMLDVLFLDTTRTTQNNHNFTAGWERRISPKTSIGASLIYSINGTKLHAINNAGYNVLPDSLLSFRGTVDLRNHWHNLVSSVWLEQKIREDEKITFDMDYLLYSNDNPSEVQSSFTDKHGDRAGTNDDSLFSPAQRGHANTLIRVGVVKADYERQLNRKLRLESGAKGTYTRTSSTSGLESVVNGEWTPRSETVNNVVMREGIAAAYASVDVGLDSATHVTMGARYEYSDTRLPAIHRSGGFLFPSLFFSHKVGARSEVQLSYTGRISRPTYNDLASFVGYVDPVAVFTGNPLLRPTITKNVKLGYNIGDYTFSVLAGHDDHPIQETQLTESPDKDLMYVSPQNFVYRDELTFQANLPWKVNDWWNMSYSLTGGWRRFKEDFTVVPVKKTWFGCSLSFTQTFRLPKSYSAELSGWWNSSTYWGMIRAEGFGALNVGVKKDLKNNGGTLQVAVSDVLRTLQIRMRFGTLTREAFATTSYVRVNTESRIFPIIKLTYSRSFGTGPGAQQRERKGSRDEIDRIRK
ncbi:outer membrane beta-barrel family protein [Flavitalea sp. BT771]|uniref:outer membrane beta-barrel family protein n=1 Tax=Flavitalea sp. BT771 TaxID=3063329 RepID=UPI0026E3A0A2|nr:outer membrane beta-barrel family protein [Flavitalea sp. BT771]MDO6429114.1 outer membrane beta-barrel family protein [Flavitalea sp. BT771]MDV6218758.1 outer membrane beta-barrel family protein [Flavitalea sp. BT771]